MFSLKKNIRQFWERDQSLSILSVFLIIHIFIIIPFGQKGPLQQIIFIVFYISLLAAGVFMLTTNKVLRIFASVVLALLVLLSTGVLLKSAAVEIINDFVIVLFCILLSWVVLVRTFGEGPVTVHRIQGSIVVYLLISFIFALLYHLLFLMEPDTAFKGLGTSDRKELMYFSLTTLTTTGYGDITPSIAASRSLANLEGLIGQLYPAILIARLVSMEFEYSKRNKM